MKVRISAVLVDEVPAEYIGSAPFTPADVEREIRDAFEESGYIVEALTIERID